MYVFRYIDRAFAKRDYLRWSRTVLSNDLFRSQLFQIVSLAGEEGSSLPLFQRRLSKRWRTLAKLNIARHIAAKLLRFPVYLLS